jgi:hypothetical protein
MPKKGRRDGNVALLERQNGGHLAHHENQTGDERLPKRHVAVSGMGSTKSRGKASTHVAAFERKFMNQGLTPASNTFLENDGGERINNRAYKRQKQIHGEFHGAFFLKIGIVALKIIAGSRFYKAGIYYFTILDILYILKLFYTSFARFLLLVVRDAGVHDNRDRRPGRVRKKLDRKIGRKRAPCPSSGHGRHVQGHNAEMPETRELHLRTTRQWAGP